MNNEIMMAGPWIADNDEAVVPDVLRDRWYGKNFYRYAGTFDAELAMYHDPRYAPEELAGPKPLGRPFPSPLISLPALSGQEEAGRRNHPVSNDVFEHGINLHCMPKITGSGIHAVCDGIHRILGK